MTAEDTEETLWKRRVDFFALEYDYCNGPECVDCGERRCQHCAPEWYLRPDCG